MREGGHRCWQIVVSPDEDRLLRKRDEGWGLRVGGAVPALRAGDRFFRSSSPDKILLAAEGGHPPPRPPSPIPRPGILLLLLTLLANIPAPAPAAPRSLATDRFLFVFEAADRRAVEHLAEIAPQKLARIEQRLRIDLPVPIHVYLQERLQVPGVPHASGWPEWVEGLAVANANTILLRSPRTLPPHESIDEIFAHELAHLALGRRVPDGLPRWLNEGLAMLIATEIRPGDIPLLTRLAALNALTDFSPTELDFQGGVYRARAAYAQSLSMVHYLKREKGWPGLALLLDHLAAGEDLTTAAAQVYEKPWPALVDEWRSGVRMRYTWLPLVLSGSLVWVLASPVVGFGLLHKWRDAHRRIRAMAEEEAVDDEIARVEKIWERSYRVPDPEERKPPDEPR